jgi:hypothetical protein
MAARKNPSVCQTCGVTHQGPLYKYCSKGCQRRALNASRRASRVHVVVTQRECKNCHTLFTPSLKGYRLYCTRLCQSRHRSTPEGREKRRAAKYHTVMRKHGL